MSTYALSGCIAESLELGKKYFTEILLVFTQESNPFKIALDSDGRILSLYRDIASNDHLFAFWLDIMSRQPSNFEKIRVKLPDELQDYEIFLKVCSCIRNQNKLIIHSHNNLDKTLYTNENQVLFNEKRITIFDRDEAIGELDLTKIVINADHSIVAANGSSISDIKQLNKKRI